MLVTLSSLGIARFAFGMIGAVIVTGEQPVDDAAVAAAVDEAGYELAR